MQSLSALRTNSLNRGGVSAVEQLPHQRAIQAERSSILPTRGLDPLRGCNKVARCWVLPDYMPGTGASFLCCPTNGD